MNTFVLDVSLNCVVSYLSKICQTKVTFNIVTLRPMQTDPTLLGQTML